MNRVAIVVLNWNGIEDTILCLDSLRAQTYSNRKIIVVDNNSTKDDSVARLEFYKSQYPEDIELIQNSNNLGFAGGVNTGIRWSVENNYDSVALFNNDATADKNWLSELIKAFDDPSIGISTGLLLHTDGKTIDSTGDFYSIWGLPFPRSRGEAVVFAPDSGPVFGASGGATLYRTEVFKTVGLFDEDFFAYYEDVDISFQAQLADWKVHYSSEAIAHHKQGASSNKIPGFTVTQTFKNLPWLFIKNVPRELLLFVGARFLLAYILMFGNAVFNGKGLPAVKGLALATVKIPKKISERLTIQKSKKVPTSYIDRLLWNDLPPDQTGLRKFRGFFTKSE